MSINLKGMTLMELLIAVILVGIIAGFAVPNYTKSQDRARERAAAGSLMMIKEALELYYAREESYPAPAEIADIDKINQTLSLEIIPGDMIYVCGANPFEPLGGYECRATSPSGWWLHVETGLPAWPNVHCDSGAGTCPTCNPACSYVF